MILLHDVIKIIKYLMYLIYYEMMFYKLLVLRNHIKQCKKYLYTELDVL